MCLVSGLAGATALTEAGAAATINTGLAAATAGANFVARSQQVAAQNAAVERSAESAVQARNRQIAGNRRQLMEQRDRAAQNLFQRELQAEQAKARARASSAEGGVSGESESAIQREFQRQLGRARLAEQFNFEIAQVNERQRNVQAQSVAENRINRLQPAPDPSVASLLLPVGRAAFRSYTDFFHFPQSDQPVPFFDTN